MKKKWNSNTRRRLDKVKNEKESKEKNEKEG